MKKAFNNRRDILTAVIGSILLTGYIAKSYSEYLDNAIRKLGDGQIVG